MIHSINAKSTLPPVVKSTTDDHVLLGVIGKAKGLKGQVWVYSYTASPSNIAAYGELFDDRGRTFRLRAGECKGSQVVISIDGVADRNTAESLRGTKLYVRRENLPELDGNQFYITDLIGLSAVDESGAVIGRVADVYNYGAGDIIDIETAGNDEGLCLPFHDDFVPHVDLFARRIVIRIPDEVFADDREDDA